jgi:hypothetical protein
MMRRLIVWLVICVAPCSHALLVVGDSGTSSIYTNPAGAGSGWNYVGHLVGSAPSSVTYVSNGWFLTATHVWFGDVINKSQTSLSLGGSSYTIDTGSYQNMTNSNGTASDVCMFRVTGQEALPAGYAVIADTPVRNAVLRMIGNGLDNAGNTGMTWGDSDIAMQFGQVLTGTAALNGRETTYYAGIYDSEKAGSARGNTYDSGGGVFVDGKLCGIMLAVGTLGLDEITAMADFATYGAQINDTIAIPEPAVMTMIIGSGIGLLACKRFFLR